MPLVDMPLEQLRNYKPESTAKPDFDEFWNRAKQESAARPLNLTLEKVDHPARNADVYDLKFEGADGTPVHGWLLLPKGATATEPAPVVVRYHGYTGGRGYAHDMLIWTTMGMAALTIDTRGQGGLTPDYGKYPTGGVFGWMTQGLTDPDSYYYKNVYLDCLRAIDAVHQIDRIDTARIAIMGGSQGGALTLAVAGLDDRVKLAMPIYPYLCDFRRSVETAADGPYSEIRKWFRYFDPENKREEEIFANLSYFDGMNHAARIKARTLMAITLQDVVCPPSTCFAAYNHISADKEHRIYPEFGHEHLAAHDLAMMEFVSKHL